MTSKTLILTALLLLTYPALSQNPESELSIEKIMQGAKFVGTSPDDIFWAEDGNKFYFNWDTSNTGKKGLFSIDPENPGAIEIESENNPDMLARYGKYNKDKSKKTFSNKGNIYIYDLHSRKIFQVTSTTDYESSPYFSFDQKKIYFNKNTNLFSWDINSGQTRQLTNFSSSQANNKKTTYSNDMEKWLYEQQLYLFQVLREKDEKTKDTQDEDVSVNNKPVNIYIGKKHPADVQISPDEKFISYLVYERAHDSKKTLIPEYVNKTGYTSSTEARTKVGTPYFERVDLFIYSYEKDTVYQVKTNNIPDIDKQAEYLSEYPSDKMLADKERAVSVGSPIWSEDGRKAILEISSIDNKDRWIMKLNPENGDLSLLEHQHDEAWIGGPGTGRWGATLGWMPDNKSIYFQSEETGYSHLYTLNTENGKKKALTKGNYEIYAPFISKDKKYWYFSSNEVNTGERHFYKMPIKGGRAIRLTTDEGNNTCFLSPDEKWIAIRFSSANKPWDLYLKRNQADAVAERVTNSQTSEFKSYKWRIPSYIKFKASDGTMIPARLYLPDHQAKSKPAVIFVHGAGYLQNAHKWWSSYFREYMFHNFLTDNGYTVLDIDYRGSAGYGRDWRTAIYRHMGGKDLSDQVDGAAYLVKEYGISAENIGIYGGSYGGFITLMALFTEPDIFGAGAALRSVTDWAHYNHGYTASILNTPLSDSIAYVRSSPIYFAEGLNKPLLICHGMIDDNVHFQDVVRLVQRLIELGKENWELAVYPVERHGFKEASSWTDEYKRIFKLFEENLK